MDPQPITKRHIEISVFHSIFKEWVATWIHNVLLKETLNIHTCITNWKIDCGMDPQPTAKWHIENSLLLQI